MFFAKSKKLGALVAAAILAASAIWLGGCGSKQAQQQHGTQVKVMQVIQQDTPIYSEYAGQIVGKDQVKVQSKVSGNVVEKYVEGGDFVEAGQPLYRIDSRQYESAVLAAQATLAQTQATLNNAETDLARDQQLYASNAVSEQVVTTQQANVQSYQALADAHAAQLRKAQQDLADTTIYAPMTGQLGVDDVAIGTFATAGNTSLVTIGTSDPVFAQFSLSETEYLKQLNRQSTEMGQPRVTITLADGTVYPAEGVIVQADRALKDKTGTLTIKALFPNPQNILLPGMFARVRISGEVIPNAILVPQRAVQQLLGKSFVMVVGEDGKSAAKNVELGDKVGSYYVVKSGLDAGDNVIVEGLSSLKEGMDLLITQVTPEDMGFSLTPDDSKFNDSDISPAEPSNN